jgi:biopolymer transport protein ExbB
MRALSRALLAGAVALFGATTPVCAAERISLDELLEQVKAGRARDARENQARIEAFEADQARQAKLLTAARAEQEKEEQRSQDLEARFENNETRVAELEQQLQERLGSLKELFGVLQQVAGDARGQFDNSLTQVQFPERSEFLTALAQKMGQTSRLASLEEIERLWFELQREMTESGKVSRFTAPVISASGERQPRTVTRVGVFNVVADGKYLNYVPETGNLVELPRQPRGRYLQRASQLEAAVDEMTAFGIDPTRGQILSLLVQEPTLRERIEQGGAVGYVIIALGAIALLVALERLLVLTVTSARVRRQTANLDQPGDNPLGRVLKVYQDNPRADVETLELKLAEAVLKETPRFNRMLMLLKIIAVVAPLLGLLGTVIGMIITFQAITLFGTGDPKLMAGGISQALVTTVLGLCVAIPTVLLHTLVASRSRRLTQVLEEQGAGLIAEQAERQHTAAAAPA